ncbi:hypothetical protein [Demequina gelatinilytica]|uniref:hypothetical protein n=1 Tax=Demequina gelatinilytica TaxID=1638980 RepID=UPI0007822D78|nr:hypothetical protein [Demequina gelatinilytica]
MTDGISRTWKAARRLVRGAAATEPAQPASAAAVEASHATVPTPEPAPAAAPAPEPEPEPAPFTARAAERLRARGGPYPGAIRQTDHPEDLAALLGGTYEYAHLVDDPETAAPPADLVFAAVCNDKYAPGLEALVLSLIRQYPGLSNRFLVFHDDSLSEFTRTRLSQVYPAFDFQHRDPASYDVTMGDQYNHVRVGQLGYLTVEVLTMEEPSWIVVLDADLLILGDISALWRGDAIKAVPDIGHRPYAIETPATGRLVINSGVLSLPRSERGPEATLRMKEVLATVDAEEDPALSWFADQKFWNLYLARRDVELLPQAYNMNKMLLELDYPEEIGSVRILHLTGPKPWYAFVYDALLRGDDRKRYRGATERFRTSFALWNQSYVSAITALRTSQFRSEEGAALDALRGSAAGRPAVLIGNGPSLRDTDMSAFVGYEKIAFNWFVNHEDFDTIRPDHLVLPSHMLFGGWHTPHPQLPREFLDALTAREHKPTLWASFYFKPYLETLEELRGYTLRYFLFEKPFKRRIGKTGWAPLDLMSPLVDSNTGVLTAGVPMALHLGASAIVLVGCDSNYASAAGSYFYAEDQHASATTAPRQLVTTWKKGGAGPFGYSVVRRELDRRGVPFLDTTLDGNLDMLERIGLEEARALGTAGAMRPRATS